MCPSCGEQAFEGSFARRWNEERDPAAAIGHLERLTARNPLKPAAGMLAELPDADPFHVLHGSMSAVRTAPSEDR